MGGEDDADPAVPPAGDDVAHDDPSLRVDPGGGLVQEQDSWPADEGEGQRQPLLLPPGQPAPRGAPDRGETHQLEQLGGVLGIVVVAGEEVEDLGRAEHGVDAPLLQHDPDVRHQGHMVAPGVEPQHPDRAAVDRPVALERLDRAGLAGTVRAEEGDDLSRCTDERQAVDGHRLAVADHHLVTDDGGSGRGGHGRRLGVPERAVSVVHGWSRYRCPRHDRYPTGERRQRVGAAGARASGCGPGGDRPPGRARCRCPRRGGTQGRAPVRGEVALQAGGGGAPVGRRGGGRRAGGDLPCPRRRGAGTQRRGRVGTGLRPPGTPVHPQPPRPRRAGRRRPRGQRGGAGVSSRCPRLLGGTAGPPLGDRIGARPPGHGARGEAVRLDVPPLPGVRGPAAPGADLVRPRPTFGRVRGDPPTDPRPHGDHGVDGPPPEVRG